jgi:hypothetical protein
VRATEQSTGLDGRVLATVERNAQAGAEGSDALLQPRLQHVEGTLLNQSERGGRLSFGEALAVPSTFELAVAGENRPRTERVRWRSMTALGVEFV